VNWHVPWDLVSYNRMFLYTHARRGNEVVHMRGAKPILSQQEREGRDGDLHLRLLIVVKWTGYEYITYEDLGRCQDLHVRQTTIVGPYTQSTIRPRYIYFRSIGM
jgi:hypothetical protein